jgi:thiamine biosynthesis protein ThiI
MRRGVALDLVFCNLGGASHELGTLRVAKELVDRWAHGERPVLHAVDFAALLDEIRGKSEQRYWQILLKRLMVRAACAVARERRCEALVTGDALGQVSSQTLTNLAVVGEAARLPILRPLVGANKEEIIAQSRVVGTHDLSQVVDEYCAMVPRRPATHASLGAVLEQEAALDLSLLDAAVSARRRIDLRGVSLDAIGLPELETTEVPEGATVIDLRPKPAFAGWHWPDAVRLDFSEALRVLSSLDPEREYVLYCDFGLMSAHLAELMQKQGLRARHVRGGTATLRRFAADADRAGRRGSRGSAARGTR